jgi:hypothetical protein
VDFKVVGIVAEFNGKSHHNFPTYSALQNVKIAAFSELKIQNY